MVEHVARQVLEQVPLAALVQSPLVRSRPDHPIEAQCQACRPALRAFVQALHDVGLAVAARSNTQAPDLRHRKTQLRLTELGQFAARPQPCERQRRIDARGNRDGPVARQAVDEQAQKLEHALVSHAVQIVQRDHAVLHFGCGERVREHGGRLAQARLAPGHADQRLRSDAPRRVARLQRFDEIAEQALQIVFVVGGDPGGGAPRRQARQLPRQRSRLAVPGGCDQQDQAVVEQRIAEAFLQIVAFDQADAELRRLDFCSRKDHADPL
ncbi:MAG: hypothetical protein WKG52_09695 [Variovorax sp.]